MVGVVGLFMNAAPETVERTCRALPLQILQFHGNERPEDCAGFGRPWWKALPMSGAAAVDHRPWGGASALVLDSHAPGQMGGSGRTLDWAALRPPPVPWVLAGGLNPDNIAAALAALAPTAVDVSSGIESAPGCKDARLMQRFMENVQHG